MFKVCIRFFTRYFGLSKADFVFLMYTWWMMLPVMAMPTPELDPSVAALRAQFITEAVLVSFKQEEKREDIDSGYMSPTVIPPINKGKDK